MFGWRVFRGISIVWINNCILILNTPLIEVVQEDILILKAEKNGQYSLRNTYICMKTIPDDPHLQKPGLFSGIWKLQVPPKVKSFM